MLHSDMKFSRFLACARSINESMISRIFRNLKRSKSNEKTNLDLTKGLQTIIDLVLLRVKGEGGSSYQGAKPYCSTC